jgi:hypothetical protein
LLWNYPIMNLILDIIFAVLIVRSFCVVLHNWREFATERARLIPISALPGPA